MLFGLIGYTKPTYGPEQLPQWVTLVAGLVGMTPLLLAFLLLTLDAIRSRSEQRVRERREMRPYPVSPVFSLAYWVSLADAHAPLFPYSHCATERSARAGHPSHHAPFGIDRIWQQWFSSWRSLLLLSSVVAALTLLRCRSYTLDPEA